MGSFADAMKGVGKAAKVAAGLVAGLAGAASAAALGVGKMALNTAKQGDELVDLSNKTGISVERLQEMEYAGRIVGTDLDTMTGSMSKMIRAMGTAKAGGAAADSFKALGVNVLDANGNLRDSEAVFGDAINALGGIQNEAERDALAMSIFGKSALELNPLIIAGADTLAKLSEEAHKVGAVMSTENVEAAAAFQDQLDGLTAGLKGTVATIGAAFLPAFAGIATKAGGYLEQFAKVVGESDGNIGKMVSGISRLASSIIQEIAKQLPSMMQAGLSIIQGIITAIVSNLPVILPAAIQILKSLVDFLVANLPMILNAALQIITMLANSLMQNLPMILKAGIDILVSLLNGITSALPTMIPTIMSVIFMLSKVLLDNLPTIVTAGIALLQALITGMVAALPILITQVPLFNKAIFDAIMASLPIILKGGGQIIITWINGMVANLPLLITTAVQLITTIAKGMGFNLPLLATQGKQIVTTVKSAIDGLLTSLNQVGISIVDGVWKGIQSRRAYFNNQVMSFFKGIIDSVKDILGISSPSKVFAGIGRNMALGLDQGFLREMDSVQRKIAGMSLSMGYQGVGVTGSSYQTSSENYTFYAPVTIGGAAGQSIGNQVKAKRY
jgi:phage-related protein